MHDILDDLPIMMLQTEPIGLSAKNQLGYTDGRVIILSYRVFTIFGMGHHQVFAMFGFDAFLDMST